MTGVLAWFVQNDPMYHEDKVRLSAFIDTPFAQPLSPKSTSLRGDLGAQRPFLAVENALNSVDVMLTVG